MKLFRDFLRSPFHNTNKNVVRTFEYIRKYHPDYGSAKAVKMLSKERIFGFLYPGKKLNDIVLRILFSDLIKLAEEFLTYQGMKKYDFEQFKYLLQELNEKGIDNLYKRTYKEGYKLLLEHNDLRSKFLKLFEFEMNLIDFNLQRNKQQVITGNVLTRSEYLICFFILELAGNIHDLDINELTFNAKFDFNLAYEFINNFDFDGLLEKMKQAQFKHYTTILIYVNMIKAILNKNDDNLYDDFKKTVFEQYNKLGKQEGYNLLTDLETCCLNRRKFNPLKYEYESYLVYQFMLEKKNYSYYGEEMGLQRYKNMLVNFVNLKKFDEVEKFVNLYINKVAPAIRDNLFLYSMALIDFNKKNYVNALQLIQKISYDYFTLKYDVKNLTLRIYYELKYYENAFSLIDTYRHFLLKNKSVSEFYRERYLNFVGYIYSLIRFSSGSKEFEISKLRNSLANTYNVVSREWLLEKIDELEQRKVF